MLEVMWLLLLSLASLTSHIGRQELGASGERKASAGAPGDNQWEHIVEFEIFVEEWTAFVGATSQQWTTLIIVSALLLRSAL